MNRAWAVYATPVYGFSLRGKKPSERAIATFESREAAEHYIEKSRLKKVASPIRFRHWSLLRLMKTPVVREYEVKHPPHEPDILKYTI